MNDIYEIIVSKILRSLLDRDWLTLLEDMMKKDCVDLSSSEQVAQLLQRQKVFIAWYMIYCICLVFVYLTFLLNRPYLLEHQQARMDMYHVPGPIVSCFGI